MTKAQKNRLIMILCFFVFALGVVLIVVSAFYNDISYFVHPSDLQEKTCQNPMQRYRLGGRVKGGSLQHHDGTYQFILLDDHAEIRVMTQSPLPPFFKDNQGIIVEGTYDPKHKVFLATRVLAKHDETYKPKSCPKT